MQRFRAPRRAAPVIAALACLVGGPSCVALDPVADGPRARAAIVGGSLESGHPLVGALAVDYWGQLYAFCSATAVSPTVLLTAAHCLDAFDELEGMTVLFVQYDESGRQYATWVDDRSRTNEPRWAWDVPGYLYDIGLVRLETPLPVRRYPALRRERVTRAETGTELLAVGFGVTSADGDDSGVKRSIAMELTAAFGEYFEIHYSPAEDWRGVCYGDSGGPSLLVGEDRTVVYGVHARTMVDECGPGEDTSVGDFYGEFVRGALLSLEPGAEACGDGTCTGLELEADCPEDCFPSVCGNGVLEQGEACEDGNTVDGDGCSADCRSDERCGNLVVDLVLGEQCDDGNLRGGDGCSADCRSDERCGNGVVDVAMGEQCDDGNLRDGDGCSSDCRSDERCGNGVVDLAVGERCDDGNLRDGDGCSSDCRSDERCGNGVVDLAVGELCDDGNLRDDDGCPADCRPEPGCGNGVLEPELGEQCDDGNRRDGDRCPADCGVSDLGLFVSSCECRAAARPVRRPRGLLGSVLPF